MTKGTIAAKRYPVYGSLALCEEEPVHFEVIEGGKGSKDQHRATREMRRDACSQQDMCRSKAYNIVVFTLVALVLGAMLAVSCLVCDLRAEKRYQQLFGQVSTTELMVHSGDSLWDIAAVHEVDGASTREVVDWIKHENGLSGGIIFPGQIITVPIA